MDLKMEDLRKLAEEGSVKWTQHAMKRMRERGIKMDAVYECIQIGEIIKQYPDDRPLPSCLLCAVNEEKAIHVVLSSDGEFINIITAYYPSEEIWEADFKTRKAGKE